ncbi:MAG: SOS response-associated peptidase [Thermogutta sp.]
MCGRFTLRAAPQDVAKHFSLFDVPSFSPRYNIAPGQMIGAVRPQRAQDNLVVEDRRTQPDSKGDSFRDDAAITGGISNREWTWLRWGLIPHWSGDPSIANRLINARVETVITKPAFRSAARYRRCLIPADGFYEWKKTGRNKQPYFIHLQDNRLFALAGLWDRWESPDGGILETCTILTVEPNALMAKIHNRMPLILPPVAYQAWLDPALTEFEELHRWLKPYPEEEIRVFPVTSYVNAIHNEGTRCLEPAPDSGNLFAEGST